MTNITFTPKAALDNLEFVKSELQWRLRQIDNLKSQKKVDETKLSRLKDEVSQLGSVHAIAYCIVHSCSMNPCIEINDDDVKLLIEVIEKFKNQHQTNFIDY